MKKFSAAQWALLQRLADGQCHSGSTIGETLGISRTGVWKQIQQLESLGVIIEHLPHRGYRLLMPINPLEEEHIRQALAEKKFYKPFDFHLFASIDSTNRFLKEWPSTHANLTICCTETQTEGRGRFGRNWASPFGENIYFSARWDLAGGLSHLSGFSLVAGLAILSGLKDSGLQEEIQLKWPNDLLWKNKKLGGVLIEVIAETNGQARMIVGIGLNVHQALSPSWCSLQEITGTYHDRNLLLACLMVHLDSHMERFLSSGLAPFMTAWEAVDYLKDQFVTVSQPTMKRHGQACGINEWGQLILRDHQNNLHYLSSGDTSLKER